MKKLMVTAVLLILAAAIQARECARDAKEVKPKLAAETRKTYELNLAKAFEEHDRSRGSADSIIWLGRRIAYLGNYKDAIRTFSSGISKYPSDARLYRHRGHRYITLRCFDDAIRDLQRAGELIAGKPDEIEPDGLPNAKNIPTSTLQSNIWYHLGLAYYLKGDFDRALKAYEKAQNVSTNPDMLAATTHWHYMTLRRMNRNADAATLLTAFANPVAVIENGDYLKLIKLYRSEMSAEELARETSKGIDSIGSASLGYGLGNWYLYNGKPEHGTRIFRAIVRSDQWASFGYIAAEAELAKPL